MQTSKVAKASTDDSSYDRARPFSITKIKDCLRRRKEWSGRHDGRTSDFFCALGTFTFTGVITSIRRCSSAFLALCSGEKCGGFYECYTTVFYASIVRTSYDSVMSLLMSITRST